MLFAQWLLACVRHLLTNERKAVVVAAAAADVVVVAAGRDTYQVFVSSRVTIAAAAHTRRRTRKRARTLSTSLT
jgi:hypothetical protein